MLVECASFDLQRAFNSAQAPRNPSVARGGAALSMRRSCFPSSRLSRNCRYAWRITPFLSGTATAGLGVPIAFFDRGAALICIFAIGAYKPV
jgi:hypothetical protein